MRADQAIRIAVVQADGPTRAGLVDSLSRHVGFEVVGPTGAHDPVPHRDGSGGAQVVVADLASALALAREQATGNGRLPAIVVTSGPDRERELRDALGCRIRGYLVAGFSVDQLADGIRAVHQGSRYLCPRAAARLAESIDFPALTAREEAVLALIAQGLCNKSIARELGIAVGTVKSHLKSTYGKLLVASRTQAVVVSQRRGLLACMGTTPLPHAGSAAQRVSNFLSALH